MEDNSKNFKYASRVVTTLRTTKDVDDELNYIYSINKPEDIISMQVIPKFNDQEYPNIPTSFVIIYIYRYEVDSFDE